ncbi:hypothetical protein Tco_0392384 [Tanacetum coccineum]
MRATLAVLSYNQSHMHRNHQLDKQHFVTNNSPLFPRIAFTCSWSVGPTCPRCKRNLPPLIVETDKVIRTVETNIVKLVFEIESFGMSSDEFNKETGSSNGLQPKQADLSCVHALNRLHLHEIYVLLSKHEADQC